MNPDVCLFFFFANMVLPFVILFQTAASCPTLFVLSLIEPVRARGHHTEATLAVSYCYRRTQDGRPALSSVFGSLKEGKRQMSFNIPAAAVSGFDLFVDGEEKDRACVHFAACVYLELFQRQRGRTSRIESFACFTTRLTLCWR